MACNRCLMERHSGLAAVMASSAAAAPTTYVVQQDDVYGPTGRAGLTAIARNLGICTKGPGNTLADWQECLVVAKQIADKNGIPWGGPPSWSAPIHVGQVLDLTGIGKNAMTVSIGAPMWLKVLGGLAVVAGGVALLRRD